MFPFKVSKVLIYFVVMVLYLCSLSGCLNGVIKPEDWVFLQDTTALSHNGAQINASSQSASGQRAKGKADLTNIIEWLNNCKIFIEQYKEALENHMKWVFGPWENRSPSDQTLNYWFKPNANQNELPKGALHLARFYKDSPPSGQCDIELVEMYLKNQLGNGNHLNVITSLPDNQEAEIFLKAFMDFSCYMGIARQCSLQGCQFTLPEELQCDAKVSYKDFNANVDKWNNCARDMLAEFLTFMQSLDQLNNDIDNFLQTIGNAPMRYKGLSAKHKSTFACLIKRIITFNSLEISDGLADITTIEQNNTKLAKICTDLNELNTLRQLKLAPGSTWDIVVSEFSKAFYDYPKTNATSLRDALVREVIGNINNLFVQLKAEQMSTVEGQLAVHNCINIYKGEIKKNLQVMPRVRALCTDLGAVAAQDLRLTFQQQLFTNRIKFIKDIEQEFIKSSNMDTIIAYIQENFDKFKDE